MDTEADFETGESFALEDSSGFTRNIFLIGPMGVGKTTIGRQLALHMEREFKDSDREIEERTGASIPLIFELEGESGFRRREHEMLDELSRQQHIVLATGGGAVLDPQNRNWLRERGWVIYLHASIDHLIKRTRNNRNRPLLDTEDPRARLEQILHEREPLYESTADIKVETGSRNVQQVIKHIMQQLPRSPL